MNILVAGDSFVSVEEFRKAFSDISKTNNVRYIKMNEDQKLNPISRFGKKDQGILGLDETINRRIRFR